MVAIELARPRVRCVPAFGTSLAAEAVDLARDAGLTLDDWQADVLEASLGVNEEDGRWASFEIGLDVSRQNGKGGILEGRELAGLFLVPTDTLLIHTAHEADTSFEAFYRLEALIQDTQSLHGQVKERGGYKHGHGQESINLKNGKRILFKTRTHGGRRGFSADLLIFDEAMFIPEFTIGALMPILSARPNPQVWYTGSAVDQHVHEHGVVFSRVRERGHRGDDPRLAFFEWSLPFDSPAEVPEEVAADPEAWAAANPALGIRISAEHVANEQRSMGPREFAVERLGVGDWPPTSGAGETPISLELWADLVDPASKIPDPVCLAFDVSPDRARCSIAAAGLRRDGLFHVEMIERERGTGWLPAKLAELVAKHQPAAVVCDAAGPAGSLLPALEDLDLTVSLVSATEHGRACGLIFDSVENRRLRHLGQPELLGAIKGAKKRPLGDAWAWSRKSSATDISPLVACTLALWAASERRPVYRAASFA